MRFYAVSASQERQWYDGEYDPYPPDLYALHTKPGVPRGLCVRVRSGSKPGDCIFATHNVFSPRFVEILAAEEATGYATFPVPLRKEGKEVATFYGLKVHGRGGPFDDKRSGAEYSRHVPDLRIGYEAVYMDEDKWDGGDVFFIPNLGVSLFLSERIAKAIQAARLANVILEVNSKCRFGTKAAFRADESMT